MKRISLPALDVNQIRVQYAWCIIINKKRKYEVWRIPATRKVSLIRQIDANRETTKPSRPIRDTRCKLCANTVRENMPHDSLVIVN